MRVYSTRLVNMPRFVPHAQMLTNTFHVALYYVFEEKINLLTNKMWCYGMCYLSVNGFPYFNIITIKCLEKVYFKSHILERKSRATLTQCVFQYYNLSDKIDLTNVPELGDTGAV